MEIKNIISKFSIVASQLTVSPSSSFLVHGLTDEVFTVTSFRTAPIHAEAPEFTDMSVEQEILVTGIKVVDLLAPYAKGGKIGQCNVFGHFSGF